MLDAKPFMQLELLGQGLAQFLIVVDQQDRLGGGHVVGVSGPGPEDRLIFAAGHTKSR